MPLTKRLLKHPLTQKLLAALLAAYIRLVYYTSRKSLDYHPDAVPYLHGDDNAIFAFWHGRMMLCPTICPPKRQMRVLISLHRDGILISSIIAHFNQKTVSGSTSRGGKAAVVEMLKALKQGDNISITPDGPRGPFQQAAPGAITVARLSERRLLPVTFSASRAKRLKSWDRFMLALPFGRIVFCVGAPIVVKGETDEEAEQDRLRFEHAMNALVEKADHMLA
jgi:lysophospholipid acyltransferase (LPLAT)-like uncharacterized protein